MKIALLAIHFNPRSPHGERHGFPFGEDCCSPISTHAPRTGSDTAQGDLDKETRLFQPTLPARGATWRFLPRLARTKHFNPRSPHGERPEWQRRTPKVNDFNPRSPHGERPTCWSLRQMTEYFNPRSPHGERRRLSHCHSTTKTFQPTLPARGATRR